MLWILGEDDVPCCFVDWERGKCLHIQFKGSLLIGRGGYLNYQWWTPPQRPVINQFDSSIWLSQKLVQLEDWISSLYQIQRNELLLLRPPAVPTTTTSFHGSDPQQTRIKSQLWSHIHDEDLGLSLGVKLTSAPSEPWIIVQGERKQGRKSSWTPPLGSIWQVWSASAEPTANPAP